MTEPNRQMLPTQIGISRVRAELSPAWREFIRFCGDLRHGEIERLIIQDGLPVMAEMTRKKVKFHARPERGIVS